MNSQTPRPHGFRSVTVLGVIWAVQLALLMLYMPFQFQVGTARNIYPYLPYYGTAYGIEVVLILAGWSRVGLPVWTARVGEVLLIGTLAAQCYIIAIVPRLITGVIFYGAVICGLVLGAFFPDREVRFFRWTCALLGLSFGALMLAEPGLFPSAVFGTIPVWIPPLFLLAGVILAASGYLARLWKPAEWWSFLVTAVPFVWFAYMWGANRQLIGVAVYGGQVAVMAATALHLRRPWHVRIPAMRRRVTALAVGVSVVPVVIMGATAVYWVQSVERLEAWDSLRMQALQAELAVEKSLRAEPGRPVDVAALAADLRLSLARQPVTLRVVPATGESTAPNGNAVEIREVLEEHGRPNLTATIRRSDLGLDIVVSEPLSEAYDRANQLGTGALLLTGLIAFTAAGLSLALSTGITRGLLEVRDVAAALGTRHFGARIQRSFDSGDEVGDLAQAINAMAETLEVYSEELHRLLAVTDTALAHLSLVDLLQELQQRIKEILAVDASVILLPTPDGKRLTVGAFAGLEPDLAPGRSASIHEGFAGRVIASGEVLMIEDVAACDVRSPFLPDKVASLMGVPLLVENRVIGVVEVGTFRSRQFTLADARLLQMVADRIALAIDHARLYGAEVKARREVEEKTLEVRRLNESLEQRVQERTAELTAANKELEAFAYSVSHDLRGPLRTVNGFSQALLEDYDALLGPDGKDYLKRIIAATERMSSLIDCMLRLSRVTRAELVRSRVDLTALARLVWAELEGQSPERQVEFRVEEGLEVNADERLIRIAMENLLGNAWKFTSKTPRAVVQVGAVKQDGLPVFFVRDNGVGFNMAYAEKLFAPFQRLHASSEFEGNGVGLAIVQQVIARHGGRVWGEGALGRGATFYFAL